MVTMKNDDSNSGGASSLYLPDLSDEHTSLLTMTIPKKSKLIPRLFEAWSNINKSLSDDIVNDVLS